MPTTEQIHSMPDRHPIAAGASPPPAPRSSPPRYLRRSPSSPKPLGHRPSASASLSSDDDPNFISILGLQLPLRTDTDFVASLRYTAAAHVLSGGAVHLRIEEFAPDPNSAASTVDALANLLNLLRGISAEQAHRPATPQPLQHLPSRPSSTPSPSPTTTAASSSMPTPASTNSKPSPPHHDPATTP